MSGPIFELRGKRVWVAGHRGMVGSALLRRLQTEGCEILTAGRERLDLRRAAETTAWMAATRPDAVFMAAAKVGGIHANDSQPADFIRDNLAISLNVIHGASRAGVKKLLYLGSSCIYPRLANQPIVEEELLTGALEPTNEWYAIAKIAGLKMCQAYRRQHGADFISAMPTNLYGIGDNFDLRSSHVVPALIRKIHDAKVNGKKAVAIWGTGRPRREFLFADDCADALVHLMKHYSDALPINVGVGEDITIAELAQTIADVVGFKGNFAFDSTMPDGTPRKLLSVDRLNALGWKPKTSLKDGLRRTYEWFVDHWVNASVAARA